MNTEQEWEEGERREEKKEDRLVNVNENNEENTSKNKTRKQRKDKGTVQITERDIWALSWIGEMTKVRVDQLQRLLGRAAQRETKDKGVLGVKTIERILTRWQKLEWVRVARILHREPAYVYLTSKGQQQAGLPYKKPWQEKVALLSHYYHVNEVRLYVEAKYGERARWISERRLYYTKEQIDGHYADGIVELMIDGEQGSIERIAVEVELTQKSARRTVQVLTQLAEAYDNVTYFVTKATRAAVEERIRALSADIRETFQIIDLSEYNE